MRFKHVLRNPDGEGGGGSQGGSGAGNQGAGGAPGGTTGDLGWRATLPEPLRADPSIAKFKDVGDLAKSYVAAQQLIGTKRLEAPQPNWDESKWNQFHDAAGRPKDPNGYTFPDGVKPREGIAFDETKLNAAKGLFHKLGLSEKQGKEVLGYYVNSINGAAEEQDRALATARETSLAELKGRYGDKLNEKLAAGRLAVEKVGGEPFKAWLDKTHAGDDPVFIDTMVKIGELLSVDSSRGGGGGSGFGSGGEQAKAEIASLRTDTKFLEALTSQHHPGHMEAVAKWEKLHAAAFPGKQAD